MNKPKKMYAGWTADERVQLEQLLNQGKSNDEIARIMGRSTDGIKSARYRYATNNHPNRIGATQRWGAWSADEDQLLMAYWNTMPHREVAEQLGRTLNSAEQRYSKLTRKILPAEDAIRNDELSASLEFDPVSLLAYSYDAGHEIHIPALGLTLRKPTTA